MKNIYVYVGAIVAVLAAALVVMAVTFWIRPALAHEWYSQRCCGGHHCRPVDCSGFITHPDGSLDWTNLHFNQDQVLSSKDGGCHVCVNYSDGRQPLCAYIATTM